MNAKMDQILADASTMREESVSRLAELESMISEAEANKTTRECNPNAQQNKLVRLNIKTKK